MRFALHDKERQAVEAMLRFVNLRGVASDAAVERCFRRVIDFDDFRARPSRHSGELTVSAVDHYTDVRAIARRWAERITTSEAERRAVAAEIAPEVQTSVTTVTTFANRHLDTDYEFGSVYAACAFAIALVLDERRGLTSRLMQCGHCGKLNLDFSPKGRPARFCSPEHKRLFDNATGAERVKKSRAKKRSKQ